MNLQADQPAMFNFTLGENPLAQSYTPCYQATYACAYDLQPTPKEALIELRIYFEDSISPVRKCLYEVFEKNPCQLGVDQLNSTTTKSSNIFSSLLKKENQVDFHFFVEQIQTTKVPFKEVTCYGNFKKILKDPFCNENTFEIVSAYFLESLKDQLDFDSNCCLEKLSSLKGKDICKDSKLETLVPIITIVGGLALIFVISFSLLYQAKRNALANIIGSSMTQETETSPLNNS